MARAQPASADLDAEYTPLAASDISPAWLETTTNVPRLSSRYEDSRCQSTTTDSKLTRMMRWISAVEMVAMSPAPAMPCAATTVLSPAVDTDSSITPRVAESSRSPVMATGGPAAPLARS